ncbi:hypothetical protein [Glycomyces sp. NPDC048151]|uniref:hypothetical protein n=1 Tax=Glycomyces sp. NPDC048151 TaxID=3364002 RepID=UPI00371A6084
MSTLPRRSGNTDQPRDPDRLGTVRRYGHSIAISLIHEEDIGRIYRLATLPGSGGTVLGEVVCCDKQASPLWEDPAADIRLEKGSMFEKGLIRTMLAIDAARDGTPIDCDEHGLRLDIAGRFFLPTVQEASA